jgi:cyclophilin family peptidyl-prolyl cis-trans isomerase/HEAT repeat protein
MRSRAILSPALSCFFFSILWPRAVHADSNRSDIHFFYNCPETLAWEILNTENNRLPPSSVLIKNIDQSGNPGCKILLARALGRVDDQTLTPLLQQYLKSHSMALRSQAAESIGLRGLKEDVVVLSEAFDREKHIAVQQAILLALGHLGHLIKLEFAALKVNSATPAELRSALMQAFGHALMDAGNSQWSPDDALFSVFLDQLSDRSHIVSEAAAFALARIKVPMTESRLNQILSTMGRLPLSAKYYLMRAIAKVKSEKGALAICTLHKSSPLDPDLTIEALRGLTNPPLESCSSKILTAGIGATAAGVVVQALQAIQKIPAEQTAPWINDLIDMTQNPPSTWIRDESASALSHADAAKSMALAEKYLTGDQIHVAVLLLGGNRPSPIILKILASKLESPVLSTPDRLDLLTLLGVQSIDQIITPELSVDKIKNFLRKSLSLGDIAVTSTVVDFLTTNKWKDFETALHAAYSALAEDDGFEGKMSIIQALSQLGSDKSKDFLMAILKGSNYLLAEAAKDTLKSLFNQDFDSEITASAALDEITPTIAAMAEALRSTYEIHTTKGSIEVAMDAVAPLTAYNFATLVQKGFYNDLKWHRVVPHFVAQGGDPRGDGFGGPGYMIRDEVSFRTHQIGTLGIATAGKDTGGSQFFINVGHNFHLDGHYTQFARVTRGISVAQKLQQSDGILYITKIDQKK